MKFTKLSMIIKYRYNYKSKFFKLFGFWDLASLLDCNTH